MVPLSGAMVGFSRSPPSQTGQNEPASSPLKICKANLRAGMGEKVRLAEMQQEKTRGRKRARCFKAGREIKLLTKKMQWEKCTGL